MSKIIICRGVPGSGKSTWAKEWVQKDPANRIRINWDDLRLMMGGGPEGYWVPAREKMPMLSRVLGMMISTALEYGKDVVIDNMNLNTNTVDDIVRMCSDNLVTPEIFVKSFRTDVNECIKRDAQREKPIGAMVIRNTAAKYADFFVGEDRITKNIPEYNE